MSCHAIASVITLPLLSLLQLRGKILTKRKNR